MDTFKLLHGSCALTVLLVNLIDVIKSVPPEYCLHRLNTSDCHGSPTTVAYYYKPGSRCEVAIWRGCPTQNKFRDEVICSHICIARIVHWNSGEQDMLMQNLNTSKSGEPQDKIQEWENELKSIYSEELETMDDILDGVGNEIKPFDKRPKIHKLKFHVEEVTTATEAKAEESTPESPTEDAMVEETTTEVTATEETTEAKTKNDSEESGSDIEYGHGTVPGVEII